MMRSTPWRNLAVLLVLPLLLSGLEASAAAVSGSTQFSFSDANGKSQYTVVYDYSPVVTLGSAFSLQATLQVNNMSGLIDYLADYTITVLVLISPQHTLSKSYSVYPSPSGYLYAGARAKPLNFTIPVNETGSGLLAGQTSLANITISFLGDAHYVSPVFSLQPVTTYDSQIGQAQVGQVRIQGTAQSLTPPTSTILVAAGAIMTAAGLLLRRAMK